MTVRRDPLPLETPRTRLRRLRVQDLPAFQAYRHDPAVGRWQAWQPMGDAAAAAFLREMAMLPFCARGQWFQIGIAARDSDELIGDIGVQLHGDAGLLGEFGFTLAAAAQGRGLAGEAVGALLQLLWRHTAAQRLVAVADTRNLASLRLLQRLGLRPFATLPAVFGDELCLEQHWVLHRHGRLPVRLRAARAADAAAVADLLIVARRILMPFVPAVHTDEEVHAWVADTLLPAGGVTVAEHAGRVQGVLAQEERDGVHWIDQLHVHPAAAGAGVGAALLAHALQGIGRAVRLYTFEANRHARAFYERHGFEAIGWGDGSANQERCPDVLYERPASLSLAA